MKEQELGKLVLHGWAPSCEVLNSQEGPPGGLWKGLGNCLGVLNLVPWGNIPTGYAGCPLPVRVGALNVQSSDRAVHVERGYPGTPGAAGTSFASQPVSHFYLNCGRRASEVCQ